VRLKRKAARNAPPVDDWRGVAGSVGETAVVDAGRVAAPLLQPGDEFAVAAAGFEHVPRLAAPPPAQEFANHAPRQSPTCRPDLFRAFHAASSLRPRRVYRIVSRAKLRDCATLAIREVVGVTHRA
jgi:hypothetical protein